MKCQKSKIFEHAQNFCKSDRKKILTFLAFGHKNITANHKTTLEFTKENSVTKKGDCIIGVNSDFKNLGRIIKDVWE